MKICTQRRSVASLFRLTKLSSSSTLALNSPPLSDINICVSFCAIFTHLSVCESFVNTVYMETDNTEIKVALCSEGGGGCITIVMSFVFNN